MKKLLCSLFVVSLFAVASHAATPIQLSLWDKIAVPKNDAVHGLEIGIGSNLSELKGVSWNFIFGKTGTAVGWQAGLVTVTDDLTGLNTGFVNWSESGKIKGIQWGFINRAQSLTGLQLGFINWADSSPSFGLQIGLINYLGNSSIYKWFPFINIKV